MEPSSVSTISDISLTGKPSVTESCKRLALVPSKFAGDFILVTVGFFIVDVFTVKGMESNSNFSEGIVSQSKSNSFIGLSNGLKVFNSNGLVGNSSTFNS